MESDKDWEETLSERMAEVAEYSTKVGTWGMRIDELLDRIENGDHLDSVEAKKIAEDIKDIRTEMQHLQQKMRGIEYGVQRVEK